ncbi:SH3 domain-containing protein [Phormidium sp. CCY1219]|jgi:hypothetical protein|uniref:SH3 domain-containing protein n=1 Tax=Phormidium sp. CCY1219 TaxID=2886104 RepID=UPI002D1F99D9|nr:SH3 domain-containing protein [Phormidium sp. CCY1219]MEB3827586.1 SH3 domain-containing protein [Phormidium sp. CCY1219]
MSIAGIFKFLLGFILALAILAGGGVAATLYFVTKLTALPARPTFSNDKPPVTATTSADKDSQSQGSNASNPGGNQSSENKLEPGAYRARVTWPDGLILRDRPSYDANSIGGIEFRGEVVVLEESSDKEWEKVRVEGSNQQGWVKGGNTERIN